jgi:hypothetical protein
MARRSARGPDESTPTSRTYPSTLALLSARATVIESSSKPATVILRHCDAYDPERIRVIAREAMEASACAPGAARW